MNINFNSGYNNYQYSQKKSQPNDKQNVNSQSEQNVASKENAVPDQETVTTTFSYWTVIDRTTFNFTITRTVEKGINPGDNQVTGDMQKLLNLNTMNYNIK